MRHPSTTRSLFSQFSNTLARSHESNCANETEVANEGFEEVGFSGAVFADEDVEEAVVVEAEGEILQVLVVADVDVLNGGRCWAFIQWPRHLLR